MTHTTHHDDCGCMKARIVEEIAALLREERERNYSPARAPLIYRKMFGASVTPEILNKARELASAR